MVRIALDPTPYHSTHDVEDFFDVAAKAGYEWIQLTPHADFIPFFAHPRVDRAQLARVRKRAADAGVGITSLLPVQRISWPDEPQRETAVRNFRRIIAIAAELEAVPMAGAVDEARQGVHQVVGAGRQDAAAAAGPARIWSSELLDGSTCLPCSAVDGREYESLEAAREDYPLGGFARCDGGPRCRGTLVIEYAPGARAEPTEPPASILDDWGTGPA